MDKTGEAPSSITDQVLLESAAIHPKTALHTSADLIQRALVLAVGVSQARAFVDGNTGAAFIAAHVFLRVNSYFFTGDPLEMARRIEQMAACTRSEEEATAQFTRWLRDSVTL